MLRKVASGLFLLTSVLIGIGSLGHAYQSRLLGRLRGDLRPELFELVQFVWLWASGAMAVFSALLLWSWWHIRRGDRSIGPAPWLIGTFYLVAGICGLHYVGAFFSLFIVLGATLCAATWCLSRGAIEGGFR